MERPGKTQSPPANAGATKANTRPNPNLQVRKPEATYRARPAYSAPHRVPRGHVPDRAYMRMQTEIKRQRLRTAIFLAIGLLLASGIAAYAFIFVPVKGTIDTILKTTSHIFVTPVVQRPALQGGPNATPVTVVYPDWDKKESVNILLLGLDYRPQEEDSRSDTMIVVHIDPAAKTASMLSIPRDLWVEIPGHGEARINAAYQLGETYKNTTPGGGPGLAMSTVERNFDIKIHYFAQVDFTGFERVVDAMGGVTVDVPRPLVDNEYPLSNYGTTRIYVPAGLQHLDGHTALQYARSRHADSDIGRNSRQQQVLLALRQQGVNMNLVSHLNDILTQLSDAVKTDLSISQVGSLAQLSRQIDRNSIETLAINADMARETILSNGADVLMPNWDLIKPKMKQLFANPRLANEAARISVQNGTTTSGIGKQLQDVLITDAFSIADLSSAPDQGEHPVTTITDFSGGKKPYTVEALAQALNIDPANIKHGDPTKVPKAHSDGEPVDIVVIAGDDRVK